VKGQKKVILTKQESHNSSRPDVFLPTAHFKNNFSQPPKWLIRFYPDTQSQPFGQSQKSHFLANALE